MMQQSKAVAPSETQVGANLTWEEYDYFMDTWSNDKDVERTLFRNKWFDYRFLHPAAATYTYADDFQAVYRRLFRQNIDGAAAEHIKVIRDGDLHVLDVEATTPKGKSRLAAKKNFIKAMWKGRQIADCLGVPYPFFVETAMTNTLRYWKQKHLPRPYQIFSDYATDEVTKKWAERQAAMLMFSTHDEYRNENYVGSRDQNDHHEWLFEQVAQRPNTIATLSRLVHDACVLPLEKVAARFDHVTVNQVQSAA